MSENTELKADQPELNKEKSSNQVKPGPSIIKKKKQAIWISFLMNLSTLGIWSRFRPRRGGWNGTWGLTVLFLLVIISGLVGERFFKKEINTELKTALNVEENIIPDQWAFEPAKLANNSEIAELKKTVKILEMELVVAKVAASEALITNQSGSGEESASINELNDQVGSLSELLEKANLKITELTKNPPVMKFVDADVSESFTPQIKLQTFESVDAVVGCTSRFSEERKADVFKESYKGYWLQWTGEIKHVDNESVAIAIGESSTLSVTFEQQGAGYELLKGDQLTLTFKLTGKGDCESSYTGSNAVIIK